MNPELIIQYCSKPLNVGRVCGVYRMRNTIDGKCYVGSSMNMRERWLDHIAELNSGKHCNPYLLAAWRKWGSGAFVFEVLEKCDRSHISSTELWWIEHFTDMLGWDMLYNLSKDPSAPMRGLKHSVEAKAKIKAAMSLPRKGRCKDWKHSAQWFEKRRGQKLSPDHRAKISQANKGRIVTPETRKKIGDKHRGVPRPQQSGPNNGMYCRQLSEESRAKISAARKGKPWTDARRNANRRGQLCLKLD